MYIAPCDIAILRSKEMSDLKDSYQQKFGEPFAQFNYADYPGDKKQCAAQMYLNALKKAVEVSSPYRITSHRYDEFDH